MTAAPVEAPALEALPEDEDGPAPVFLLAGGGGAAFVQPPAPRRRPRAMGPELLLAWRLTEGLAMEAAAGRMRVHGRTYGSWEHGQNTPCPRYRRRIERATGGAVPAPSWTARDEDAPPPLALVEEEPEQVEAPEAPALAPPPPPSEARPRRARRAPVAAVAELLYGAIRSAEVSRQRRRTPTLRRRLTLAELGQVLAELSEYFRAKGGEAQL